MKRMVVLCAALGAVFLMACNGEDKKSAVPGGTDERLALVRDQRLLVRNSAGDERLLVRTPPNTFPVFPVWSPDGSQIAYVQSSIFTGQANADWGGDIYVINAAGGDPRLVFKHDQPGANIQGLAWTPQGDSLLVGYQLTLIKDGKYQGQVSRTERLNLSSGERTTLIEGALLPSLSRDGTRLAYLKQDDMGNGGLFVAAADGSNAKQLFELGSKFVLVLGPRISPDGSAVAFSAVAAQAAVPRSGPEQGGGLLATLRRLLPAPRMAAAHGLPMDIWKISVADSAITRLSNLNEDEPYPTWAPDSKSITFMATGGLYEVQADGSNLRKIGPGAFGGQADLK